MAAVGAVVGERLNSVALVVSLVRAAAVLATDLAPAVAARVPLRDIWHDAGMASPPVSRRHRKVRTHYSHTWSAVAVVAADTRKTVLVPASPAAAVAASSIVRLVPSAYGRARKAE